MVTAVIKGMSAEQAVAVASTTSLNLAQKAAAMLAAGLSKEEIAEIFVKKQLCQTTEEATKLLNKKSVADMANAASTDLLTAASLKLKAAFKGIGATIKAHPILTAVAATAAVIAIGVKLYKEFGNTQENLAKKLDESKQKVQESTQKIEEMESELSNVKSRIAELQGMGSLSIVQQQELTNLEKMGSQLERNIELVKEKRRLDNKEANKAFVEWFNKDIHDKSEYGYYNGDKENATNNGFEKFLLSVGASISENLPSNKDKGFFSDSQTSEKYQSIEEDEWITYKFDKAKELIERKNEEITLEEKDQIDKQLEEIEKYYIDKTSEWEKALGDRKASLIWTPNAKEGSDEARMNDAITHIDEVRDKASLLKGEIHGDIAGAYEDIVDANLQSDRFAQAAEEIEKLKTAEDGTAKSAKAFKKDLLNLLKTAGDNSNVKQLADYLTELGMIDITKGADGITDLSEAIVATTIEAKEATKTNLLFADSYSKITAARKAFEEGLQNTESGTENFESYADSYEKAMELLNKGFDLDNGVLMAHVERLISDDQLEKLGYDADKVKEYLQEHLKGVFGDKDTLGIGFVDKIKQSVDSDGKIYAKGKDGKVDKSRELASYDGKTWHFSDKEEDIAALGKEFGMTSDQILACVESLKTFSDVHLNDTDTIVQKLKEEGKVFDVKNGKKKPKKSAVNITRLEADMQSEGYSDKDIFDTIEQLKNDKNVITVEIDAKTKSKDVAAELEKLGIFSGTKTSGKGHNQIKYRETDDIDKATKALKTFGLTGQEVADKLKEITIGDKNGKIFTDAEKLESVFKTFSEDFDPSKFTSSWETSGKEISLINVKSMRDTLIEQGWDETTVDAYIASLKEGAEKDGNKVVIDMGIEFTSDSNSSTTVAQMLEKAGVATESNGTYTIDVEQTVKLLQGSGATSDDVIAFLNNVQQYATADNPIQFTFSSNISSLEEQVTAVYTGATELKEGLDANSEAVDNLNSKRTDGLTGSLKQTAEVAERNERAIVNVNTWLDLINGKTFTYKLKPIELTPTSVTGGGDSPTTTGGKPRESRTTGIQEVSGTAFAGGNWGTAVGGKTLTGELG